MISLDENGDLYIPGDYNKGGVCNFSIPHPTDPKAVLKHTALEAPEMITVYAGRGKLINGQAIIRLPDYFEDLNNEKKCQVLLTPEDGWTPLFWTGSIYTNSFTVRTIKTGNMSQAFSWVLYSRRDDEYARKRPFKPIVLIDDNHTGSGGSVSPDRARKKE